MNTKAEVEVEAALLVVEIVSSVTNLDIGLESALTRTQVISEAEVEEEVGEETGMVAATLMTWTEEPTRGQEETRKVVPPMVIGEAGLTRMAGIRLEIRQEDGMALETVVFYECSLLI